MLVESLGIGAGRFAGEALVEGGVENGVGGARGGAREVGGRAGHEPDVRESPRANVSFARPYQVVSPEFAKWTRPRAPASTRVTSARARSRAKVGRPRWSSTTFSSVSPEAARPSIVSTKFTPPGAKTQEVLTRRTSAPLASARRSPPSFPRP